MMKVILIIMNIGKYLNKYGVLLRQFCYLKLQIEIQI